MREYVKENNLRIIVNIDFNCFFTDRYVHLLRKSTKSEGKGNLGQAIDINYPILKTLEFRIK